MVQHSPFKPVQKGHYCLTLIRGVALCRGAFSIVHGLWSLATENPCSSLAQAGRTLLLGG